MVINTSKSVSSDSLSSSCIRRPALGATALCTSSWATSSPIASAALTRTGSSASIIQSMTPRNAVSRLWLVCHFMPALSNAWMREHARKRRKASGLCRTGRMCCTKKASSMFCTRSWCTIDEQMVMHMRSAPSNWRAVHCSGYALSTCVMKASVGSNMDLVRRVTAVLNREAAALEGVPSSSSGSALMRTKSIGSRSHSSWSSSEKHMRGYTSVSMICCMCGRSWCHMDFGLILLTKNMNK